MEPNQQAPATPSHPVGKEKALSCPRCSSANTKFCYYNNYSLMQPRYFCKACRRYWTQGGSLRGVPVGGGCRRNKRASSPAAASTFAAAVAPSGTTVAVHESFVGAHGGGLGLLAPYPSLLEISSLWNHPGRPGNGSAADAAGRGSAVGALSALELLRGAGGYASLLPLMQLEMPAVGEYAAAGFALGEFRVPPPLSRSVLGFSLDAHGCAAGATNNGAAGDQSHSQHSESPKIEEEEEEEEEEETVTAVRPAA